MIRTIILLFIVGLTSQATMVGQQSVNTEKSQLSIFGTSSLHDWEIEAENFTGNSDITLKDDNLVINKLSFNVPVKSLKSGKSAMDDNTYKALKAKDHPTISYKLEKVISAKPSSDGFDLRTSGLLTIAGTTKTIEMPVKANTVNGIQFTGETTFNMSDYGVDPPTALFGTIKTGDKVTIKFNVNYN